MEHYRKGYIYLLTNKVNGKKYVGQTVKSTRRRFEEHVKCAQNGVGTVLYKAIRKYGPKNFRLRVLKCLTEPLLNAAEVASIERHTALLPNGYNSTRGGDGGGYGLLPKHRRRAIGAKIGDANRGNMSGMLNAYYATPAGERCKQRIATTLRGRKFSADVCQRHSDGLRRRYSNSAERERTSQAGLRHYQSTAGKATKDKLSAAARRRAASGQYFSEETRRKLREKALAQHAARRMAQCRT